MTGFWRRFGPASGLLLFGIAIALAFRFAPKASLPNLIPAAPGALPIQIGLRLKGVEVAGRDGKKRAWSIKAAQVDSTRARDRLEFTGGIDAILYRDGVERARILAPVATYEVNLKRMQVAGGIDGTVFAAARAKKSPGDLTQTLGTLKFRAESVIWDVATKTLLCPGTIRVIGKNGEAVGDNLELNVETQDFTLRNFRGKYRIEEVEP